MVVKNAATQTDVGAEWEGGGEEGPETSLGVNNGDSHGRQRILRSPDGAHYLRRQCPQVPGPRDAAVTVKVWAFFTILYGVDPINPWTSTLSVAYR